MFHPLLTLLANIHSYSFMFNLYLTHPSNPSHSLSVILNLLSTSLTFPVPSLPLSLSPTHPLLVLFIQHFEAPKVVPGEHKQVLKASHHRALEGAGRRLLQLLQKPLQVVLEAKKVFVPVGLRRMGRRLSVISLYSVFLYLISHCLLLGFSSV